MNDRLRSFLFAGVIVGFSLIAAVAEEPLTNEDILKMTRVGLPEAAIVKLIETRPAAFETSVEGLIALKKEGVSEGVITAIVSRVQPGSRGTVLNEAPGEPGVYARVKDRLGERVVPLPVEIITLREGGYIKSLPRRISPTIIVFDAPIGPRGHVNGSLSGPVSAARLSPPIEFLIRCAPGTAAEEYQLLRFWDNLNRREFRIATGGVVHATIGADQSALKFESHKLAPGLYRIVVKALPKGEYGFLPPGAALSASAASSGKIFTFGTE